jgi:hypothetical protein
MVPLPMCAPQDSCQPHARKHEPAVSLVAVYAKGLDEPIQPVRPTSALHRLLGSRGRAPELLRLENVLKAGNQLFNMVRLVEKNWRSEVTTGKTLFDPCDEETILGYFSEWLSATGRCIEQIESFEDRRVKVGGADEFRGNCAEARKVLAGRSSFFEHAENAERWQRLTAFLRPQPQPVRTDEQGRVFDMSGEQIVFPGLEPDKVLLAREERRSGRRRSLEEVVASRKHDGIPH